ncbi:MAG TPA: hypothetical protein VFV52_07235 [Bacilli bacterium]|nr:hypothetical protein [Bacilli bacterium]
MKKHDPARVVRVYMRLLREPGDHFTAGFHAYRDGKLEAFGSVYVTDPCGWRLAAFEACRQALAVVGDADLILFKSNADQFRYAGVVERRLRPHALCEVRLCYKDGEYMPQVNKLTALAGDAAKRKTTIVERIDCPWTDAQK